MFDLTPFEKAYDQGQNDAANGEMMIPYEDWCSEWRVGSHSAYKAGYEDYMDSQYPDEDYD